MIKTSFPYSHNDQDFLVTARCSSVDSLDVEDLEVTMIDSETLDQVDPEFSDREHEEFIELCMEMLDEKQNELELGYA